MFLCVLFQINVNTLRINNKLIMSARLEILARCVCVFPPHFRQVINNKSNNNNGMNEMRIDSKKPVAVSSYVNRLKYIHTHCVD